MINPDYKRTVCYPPSPVQEIRSLIEAAEKRLHKIEDDVSIMTSVNTEAEHDARILCREMLEILRDFIADYTGQLEKAVAEVERERADD